MKVAFLFGGVVLGFLLLVLSSLWNVLSPPTASWTDEKATRAAEVKARLSNIGPIVNSPTPRTYGGADPATLKAEFDTLKKEEEQLDAAFASAATKSTTVPKILRWSGISLAAIGLIGWYAVKQTS